MHGLNKLINLKIKNPRYYWKVLHARKIKETHLMKNLAVRSCFLIRINFVIIFFRLSPLPRFIFEFILFCKSLSPSFLNVYVVTYQTSS